MMIDHRIKPFISPEKSGSVSFRARGLRILFPMVLFFLINVQLWSQTDNEFWFAAPEISYELVSPSPVLFQNLDRPIMLYITTYQGPAIVTIDQPANSSFVPIQVTVQTDSTKGVNLTPFIDFVENKPANAVLNYGLRIRSSQPVNVFYEVQSDENEESFSLKGKNALGYEFIIPSQHHLQNNPYANPAARNSFIVVATEDSTTVTIIPSSDIEGHVRYDTFAVQLNKGQTYCARAVSGDSTAHIGGSLVVADKPVAVTVSDDLVFIPGIDNRAFDLAGDQLVPKDVSSSSFIVLDAMNSGSPIKPRLYAYAYEDSTAITFNGVFQGVINRLGCMELISPLFYSAAASVQTNKPILLYNFHGVKSLLMGITYAQAVSNIIPPLDCAGSRSVSFTKTPPELSSIQRFVIWMVTKNGNQWNFTITGNPPLIIPGNNFDTIPGTNGQWVACVAGYGAGTWPVNISRTLSNSTGRFHVYASNDDLFHYSKSYYVSQYDALNLGPDRSICPGDSILLDAGFGRTSYLWNTGDTSQSIWVKNQGLYWVQATEDSCILSDTIHISFYWHTPVNLGPDIVKCSSDSVQLDAGAGRSWYLWNTGATTRMIWVTDAGTYFVKTSDVHCTVSDTITVYNTPAPEIINESNSKSICSGENTSIQLFSNVIGTNFHWTASLISGNISGFSADSGMVISQNLINNGSSPGVVTYHIIPVVGTCAGDTADFQVTVTPGDSIKVSITASTNNICDGVTVSFTAIPTNPGASPQYQWKVNGISILNATNSTFSYIPVNGDAITCTLTSSNAICTSNNPATSTPVIMIVYPKPAVVANASATIICAGNSVTFTGGGASTYVWNNGVMNGVPFIPLNSNTYTVTGTDTHGCSNTAQVTVTVNPLPTVTANASSTSICAGTAVTLTGSGASTYVWNNGVINGVPFIPLNSNTYTVTGTDANGCSNTAQVTITVNSVFTAGVSIAASANPFCAGDSVIFTVTPVNGGTAPSYQWFVNGAYQFTGSPIFTYTPTDNDIVSCVMTSNLECVSSNPAFSNTIVMSATLAPVVTFSACFDTITTVNAKPFRLKGGLPLGGTYSGPGVNSTTGIFTPSTAGPGIHTITYTYTNAHGCSSNAKCKVQNANFSAFSCGSNLTDIRDGKVYPTVQIGSQCWMQKNLDYGTTISSTNPQTDNCIPEKYNCPLSIVNCPLSLYQWDELMRYESAPGSQGLCPPGWHVPSESEWNILFDYYDGQSRAGEALTDPFLNGFKADPDGVLYQNTIWSFADFAVLFWSSTPVDATRAWAHGMNGINFSVSSYPALKADAFPVRCLRD